jgi:transposase
MRRTALRQQGDPPALRSKRCACHPEKRKEVAMTTLDVARPVTGGVDTHLDLHVAAALDAIGGLLGVSEFPTDPEGHQALLYWLEGFGQVSLVGVEGTGSYGAGLARYLRGASVRVVEVDRPNRQAPHRAGKSDTQDAIEAARAALSGRAQGAGKTRDGNVEAIRALLVAKRSARSSKIKALNQIRHLGFTAHDPLRARLRGVPRERWRPACAPGAAATR